MRLIQKFAVCFLAVGVYGCGDLLFSSDKAPSATSPTLPDVSALPSWDLHDENAVTLKGSWAQMVVTSAVSSVPLLGEVVTTSKEILRVHIAPQGDQWQINSKTCAIDLESSSSHVQTTFPRVLIDSLEPTVRIATLAKTSEGYRYRQPRFYRVRGAQLDDPASDKLPDNADDPRVFDQDNDGHPGVTIIVDGLVSGELYVAQRSWDEFDGYLTRDGNLDGLLRWGDERSILGTSNRLLNNQPETVPNPEARHSFFLSTPVDDDADCQAILNARESLFRR